MPTLTDTTTDPDVDSVINMDAIVEALHRMSVPAYVEQTGGGCATIYAGPKGPSLVTPGEDDYPVAAGPGHFEGPGWSNARGYADDFVVGPNDDGVDDVTMITVTDPEAIAMVIAEQVIRTQGVPTGTRAPLMYEGEPEGCPSPADPMVPRTCMDCGRPTYYDSVDESYHHVDGTKPCFLVQWYEVRPAAIQQAIETEYATAVEATR